jgi:hypothetical protein
MIKVILSKCILMVKCNLLVATCYYASLVKLGKTLLTVSLRWTGKSVNLGATML